MLTGHAGSRRHRGPRLARRLAAGGALIAATFVLAACQSSSSSFTPLSYAKPQPAASPAGSNALLAALNGGILPSTAVASLTSQDRLRTLEAEYKALESAPGGLPVKWTSFDGRASGSVTAATPYQVGQQNCRQYTHTATIAGQPVTGQGAACRNADGSWTPLS
ncbi:hypothetical protein KY465_15435 [Pseudohoeflea sp. DP4N28-3]|uniref:Surface antigen domain-containing protein n=2 Tax=Pseudohoeflea coraliihabitans TaxID=2860393 RepID=A0ABS6WRS9_9HYPH|nr:hypothetical protein [Pseudohoeflea sp. DP4N28-3]